MKTLFFLIGLLPVFAFSQALHLYGGKNYDIYLGCLNCDCYDENSVWNEQGIYGNNYSLYSIWNEYGLYGNEYSLYSPWNDFAAGGYPPVILDDAGTFYGYFTVNSYRGYRAHFDLALILYENYRIIRKDVSGSYEQIFK